MKKIRPLFLILCGFFLFYCGIDEFYFLPQIPDTIDREMNNRATFEIPSIAGIPYATGYRIYYKIYIGQILTNSSNIQDINITELTRDYNAILRYTNPDDTAPFDLERQLRNRNYFELEAANGILISNIITTSGGTLDIRFPAATDVLPYFIFNGTQRILSRTSDASPLSDHYFINSEELNINDNSINPDVARNTDTGDSYAYVSMYIVSTGFNDTNFNFFTSKPTHINIFRLPEYF